MNQLASPALQEQIDTLASQGGGRVTVPAGIHICGTLHLRSNIHLHLETGAVLQGSHDLKDYPEQGEATDDPDRHRHHLICAHNCHHISITGQGIIDGNRAVLDMDRYHAAPFIHSISASQSSQFLKLPFNPSN